MHIITPIFQIKKLRSRLSNLLGHMVSRINVTPGKEYWLGRSRRRKMKEGERDKNQRKSISKKGSRGEKEGGS